MLPTHTFLIVTHLQKDGKKRREKAKGDKYIEAILRSLVPGGGVKEGSKKSNYNSICCCIAFFSSCICIPMKLRFKVTVCLWRVSGNGGEGGGWLKHIRHKIL